MDKETPHVFLDQLAEGTYSDKLLDNLPFHDLRYKVGTFSPVSGTMIIALSTFPEGYFRGEPMCEECDDITQPGEGAPAEWLVVQQDAHEDSCKLDCWFWCGCTLDT